jgi:recombinational DNA repair ATPase RecF
MENMKSNFDLSTKAGMKKVFNATNGASKSLKDLQDSQTLEIDGVLIHSAVNHEGKENTITTLFSTDGNSYAGISATVAQAAEGLINYLQNVEEIVQVQVIKGKSQAGREFLNIQLV